MWCHGATGGRSRGEHRLRPHHPSFRGVKRERAGSASAARLRVEVTTQQGQGRRLRHAGDVAPTAFAFAPGLVYGVCRVFKPGSNNANQDPLYSYSACVRFFHAAMQR